MERIRNLIRRFLDTGSTPYRLLGGLFDFIEVWRSCGLARYAELRRLQTSAGSGAAVMLSFDNLLYPIQVRPGTDDIKTVIDNIVREEWGNFRADCEPRWMIDAGAYIGDTSAYFLSRFPGLSIVALEPDSGTFACTARNLAPYGPRVTLHNLGLYTSEGKVRFRSGQTSSAITEDGGLEVAVTTIPALLERHDIERLDILKMDIEGAEESIFAAEVTPWLERVALLIIEFHSAQGEEEITRLLRKHGFSLRRYRSVWYCQRGA